MEDLPPGFRFYPTEEELVSFYLHNKLEGRREELDRVIPVLYIYDFSPWDLPQFSGSMCRGDSGQWFFFIPRQEREARGGRPNRLTTSGYWKATGSPGCVYSYSTNRVIGMKRTMVFYKGRAPNGNKTEWKMNEYRAINVERRDDQASSSTTTTTTMAIPKLRQEFSLCRVYKNSQNLRAFDRRPTSPAAVGGAHQAHHDHGGDDDDQVITSDQNHPTTAIRMSSPESSSSGDQANNPPHPRQTVGTDNWDWVVDNEPMWDLEQLDWF